MSFLFVELEYTWCDKSMTLPCGLQMGGRLLWACVLFFNLHYRVIFFPQCQVFTLHVLEYLFHLLNCYVSQMAFLRFLCFRWLCILLVMYGQGQVGFQCPTFAACPSRMTLLSILAQKDKCMWSIFTGRRRVIGLCRAWGWAVAGVGGSCLPPSFSGK